MCNKQVESNVSISERLERGEKSGVPASVQKITRQKSFTATEGKSSRANERSRKEKVEHRRQVSQREAGKLWEVAGRMMHRTCRLRLAALKMHDVMRPATGRSHVLCPSGKGRRSEI